MTKTRKDLKLLSIIVLICAGVAFILSILDVCMNGLTLPSEATKGVSQEIVEIAAIAVLFIELLFLFPQIYIGIKGLKEASNPTKAKAHVVWSFIIAFLYAVLAILLIVKTIKSLNFDNVFVLAEYAIDAIFFGCYFITALKVRAGK